MNRKTVVVSFVLGALAVAVVLYQFDYASDEIASTTPVPQPTPQTNTSRPISESAERAPIDEEPVFVESESSENLAVYESSTTMNESDARKIVNDYMNNFPAGFALQWAPIRVDDVNLALEVTEQGEVSPRRSVRITPFPNVSFDAELTNFADVGYGFTWTGKTTDGTNGFVSISTLPETTHGGSHAVIIVVNSARGAFRVEPTSNPEVYAAYESNRHYREKRYFKEDKNISATQH